MKRFKMIIVAGFILGLSPAAYADSPADAVKTAHVQFKAVTKKQDNWRKLGFVNVDEVDQTSIGQGMQVFVIDLDALKQFRGTSPSKLVHSTDQFIYPLLHKKAHQSLFFVDKIQGSWKSTGFGSPQLSKHLEVTTAKLSRSLNLPLSSFFIVQVPSLNQYFVGYNAGEKMMLVSLINVPEFGLKKHEALPVAEIVKRLQAVAIKHNGLPG